MTLATGTVTFLFTDIEGSARLWEEHPKAMKHALARHDALAAALVDQHGGTLVKSRGEGDSLFAVFARATDAVAAACALQRALVSEPWPDDLRLWVRMALHTGEADLRDGDYFGSAVNRCARLRAVAHGGQVLLSRTTYDLARDQLPPEAGLQDMGEHRLRDLARPEHVFQLLHPQLPAQFPPLRTLDALPNNLPNQLTTFVGRDREIAEVKRLLDATRLLTLTGAGGCGKTRLALQVGADVLEGYPDGVWLVELAPLPDPALVPQSVAEALSVKEETGKPIRQSLVEHLKSKHLLLVLDNCEHLLESCAALSDTLLRACPGLRILATSREPLSVAGETSYRVPSLSLPDPKHLPPVEELSQYEAVRLFIERATSALPTFTVTNQSAPALASVCHRLDGIPLAIELAAARVRSLSIEEIDARLDNRFRLLTGGNRSALPRQQTLRAMIDWSYGLLTEPEKALLRRLSVFSGGWTLAAAEAVCSGNEIEEWEVLDLLSALVDKSLVLAEPGSGGTRYGLLETLRQYAHDRLTETNEERDVHRRHRDYFLALAEEAEPNLKGPAQATWLNRLEVEHDNLRVALDFCLAEMDADAVQAGLRLAGTLSWFWFVRGHWSEGQERCAAVLEMEDASAPGRARADVLLGAAILASEQGEKAAAQVFLEESLRIHQELGDTERLILVLNLAGNAARLRGEYGTARAFLDQSLPISREAADQWGTSFALGELGALALDQGDPKTARVFLEESLRIDKELKSPSGIAWCLALLGWAARLEGDPEAASRLQREGLGLFREVGITDGMLFSLAEVARLAAAQAKWERAAYLLGAVERQREIQATPLSPDDIVDYDSLPALRAALGIDVFDAAWAKGRTMSLEQAVKYALEEEAWPSPLGMST